MVLCAGRSGQTLHGRLEEDASGKSEARFEIFINFINRSLESLTSHHHHPSMGLPLFLSDTLGLTKIPPHIPTILWSFAGFTFVHLVLAPWICSRWFPVAYGTKSRATKNNWLVLWHWDIIIADFGFLDDRAIHVVSQVHSIIIVAGAFYSIWTETPDRKADRFYGWSNTTGFVHGIAVGYFLWDSLDAIVNYVDFGFVVHGIACLLVYVLTYVS